MYSFGENSTIRTNSLEARFTIVLKFNFVLLAEKFVIVARFRNLGGGFVFLRRGLGILKNKILILFSFHIHDIYGLLKLFA